MFSHDCMPCKEHQWGTYTLEVEFLVAVSNVVWMLRIELRSPARASSPLIH